jgi:hypothetical protein
MTVRLNGSTSGYVELDSPAVGSNNTLVLPGSNGAANQRLVTNGSGVLSWASDVMLSAGSVSAPSAYFSGDTDTGMWSPGDNILAWSTGGIERMRLTGSTFTIGTTTPDAGSNTTFSGNIAVSTNAEAWYHTYVPNAGTNLKRWRFGSTVSGFFVIAPVNDAYTAAPTYLELSSIGNVRIPAVYNLTTGAAANMHCSADGTFYRSTSSLKYKVDVEDATHGLVELMALRPVTYKGKNDGATVFGGLIAEEVHDAGLSEFVQYAEDGTPDSLAYGNMVSLAIKAIQEQQIVIEDLKARLAAVEAVNP